jgi:ABC-type amino acid transport system permease subunit
MNMLNVIILIGSGGLLGILGQGVRILVGLKKLSNSNVAAAVTGETTNEFSGSRLMVSILIGFVAGAVALLIKSGFKPVDIDLSIGMMILMAGYSGADFLEGIFNTNAAKFNADLPKKQVEAARQPAA